MLWSGTRPAEPVEVKPGVKNRIAPMTWMWLVIHRKNTISLVRDTFCVEMHEFWLQLCLKCSWTVKTELHSHSQWYITRAESVQAKLVYQNMLSGILNQTFRAYANCCSDAYKPTHHTSIKKNDISNKQQRVKLKNTACITFTSCTAVEEKSQQYTISPGSLQL